MSHGSGLLFVRVVYIMPCEINLLHWMYYTDHFELTLEKGKIKNEREIYNIILRKMGMYNEEDWNSRLIFTFHFIFFFCFAVMI